MPSTTTGSRPRSDTEPHSCTDVDVHAGAVELEGLAALLIPPCPSGPYTLTGRVARTSNALVFAATGGACGEGEGILKLTGNQFGPLLERELRLLLRCRDEGVEGVIRPLSDTPIHLSLEGSLEVVGIALPFLGGGDLAEVARTHAGRNGRLGPHLALRAGQRLLDIQRALLNLPRPLVHGDVKLQNVLLPSPGAPLSALTLIDLDSARELPLPLARLGELPPDAWQWLAQDVRDFGDLLAQLATGREGFSRDRPLGTGNPAFDTLVARCLRSFPEVSEGYTCLADEGLRFDLPRALDVQDAPPSGPLARSLTRLTRLWASRGSPGGRPR